MTTKAWLESKLHECRLMNEELQHECQQIDAERNELKRRNDDLSIHNAHLEMELKKWSERYNECHAELIEASQKLNDASEWRQRADQDFRDLQEAHNKARLLVNYYLYVELARSGEREDQRQCSQVQRFIYLLLDTLDGK